MYETGGGTMPLLQVRNCPEDIYRKISYNAKRQNRTIAQQVLVILGKGLGQDLPNIERRKELLERMKLKKLSLKAREIDDVALIREDRNR